MFEVTKEVTSHILLDKDSFQLKFDRLNYIVIQPNAKTYPIERVNDA